MQQLIRPQAIVAIVALIGGGGFLATRGGGSEPASSPTVKVSGEVIREPIAVAGPDPFTPPVVFTSATSAPAPTTAPPATSATTSPPTTGGTVSIAPTGGGTPGLYGGTLNNAECNKEQMITFLEQNPDKAKAWAQVQGIEPVQVREYIGQLTPVTLQADTRVTNHGFLSGQATPRQAVLQKGSAVLVDKFGEPRARCYCGNPLRAPQPQATSTTFTGPSWPAFDPGNMQAITPAPQPIPTFTLQEEKTGKGIARPAGSDGKQDTSVPAPPPLRDPKDRPPETTRILTPSTTTPTGTTRSGTGTTVTSTTARGATTIAGRIPAPNAFIQKNGEFFNGSRDGFPARNAVDGDPATSWLSNGGPGAPDFITYDWAIANPELITWVKVVGNGANSNPSIRRNCGFEQVTIRVFSGESFSTIEFEQTVSLNGTPDPDVIVKPGVRGMRVELLFGHSESANCAGFAELEIGVTR